MWQEREGRGISDAKEWNPSQLRDLSLVQDDSVTCAAERQKVHEGFSSWKLEAIGALKGSDFRTERCSGVMAADIPQLHRKRLQDVLSGTFSSQDQSLLPPPAPRNVFFNYLDCPERRLLRQSLKLISVPCVRKGWRTRGSLDIRDLQLSWQRGPHFKKPSLEISRRWRDVSEVNEGECWGREKGFCWFGGPVLGQR